MRPTSVLRPDAINLERLAGGLRQLLKPVRRIAAGQRGKEASGRRFGQQWRLGVVAAYGDKPDPLSLITVRACSAVPMNASSVSRLPVTLR